MKILAVMFLSLFLLSACATSPLSKQSKDTVFCKTHSKQTLSRQSPDEETLFRDCMHIKGYHEVEVRDLGE